MAHEHNTSAGITAWLLIPLTDVEVFCDDGACVDSAGGRLWRWAIVPVGAGCAGHARARGPA